MKKKLPPLLLLTALSALVVAENARAANYDFYVSTTARDTAAASFIDYQYDTVTGLATQVANYDLPSGVTGSNSASRSSLSLSGDGNILAWTGFSNTTNVITLFDLTTKTFDTSTQVVGDAFVSAWTQNGSSIYLAGVTSTNASPGVITTGGTTPTALRSTGSQSLSTIRFNNNYLFFSRNTTNTNVGIYRANAAGQITTATTWTQLTGTGWDRSGTNVYAGFDFLGANTLFAANDALNALEVYRSADPSQTNNWNLYTTLDLSSLLSGNLQQVSVLDLGSNNAQIFFTAGDGTNSSFGTVSWNYDGTNWTFGTASILGTSTTVMYQGVAAIAAVPEPGTVALCGLGFGVVIFGMRKSRKRSK